MATFSLYSYKSYEGRKLRLYCTSTINIANNTSTINWTLYSEGGSSSYYTTGPTTVTINGVEVYYKGRKNWDYKKFPVAKGSVSGSLTVAHNDDGKKSISVSLATAIYTSSVTTNSGTWTLDNIPRYATITSAPNFTDIQNPTIQYNNQIYWVNGDEFHQKKSVVEEEITLCNKLRFIPITIYDTDGTTVLNDGIGLVSVAGGGS